MPVAPQFSQGRRARQACPADRRGGFVLIEVVVALLLIGMLAALSLPALSRGAGPASLRATAYQVSALLRSDRNAAVALGRGTTTLVDAGAGRVRSGPSGAFVTVAPGVRIDLLVPLAAGIRFYADGRSSGGEIRLATAQARLHLRVNRDTGAIDLEPR